MIQYYENITYHLLVSNVKTTSHQRYAKCVFVLGMKMHTREEPYTKSVHTREKLYIQDTIAVSFTTSPVH